LDVVGEYLYLRLLAVRNKIEEVQKCPNCALKWLKCRNAGFVADLLSLAVLAFAVDDMKALESVITSARPCAFLVHQSKILNGSFIMKGPSHRLLAAVKFTEFDQRRLLVPEILSLVHFRQAIC
jgi:hypothetical protein